MTNVCLLSPANSIYFSGCVDYDSTINKANRFFTSNISTSPYTFTGNELNTKINVTSNVTFRLTKNIQVGFAVFLFSQNNSIITLQVVGGCVINGHCNGTLVARARVWLVHLGNGVWEAYGLGKINPLSVLKDGLLAAYEYENASNLGEDSHSNNLDLTAVNGPTQVDAVVGDGVEFDSTNSQYLNYANYPFPTGTPSFTFAGWVYVPTLDDYNNFTSGFSVRANITQNGDYRYVSGTGSAGVNGFLISAQIKTSGINTFTRIYTFIPLIDNTFPSKTCLIATYDRDISTFKVRFWHNSVEQQNLLLIGDGVLDGNETVVDIPTWGTTMEYVQGKNSATTYKSTILDQHFIWNRALTFEEMGLFYNNNNGIRYSDL